MSPLPRLLAATVLLAASAAASAARAQEAVDIPTRPGKTVRALLLKPAGKPVGSVILLHGGNGHLDLSAQGEIGKGKGNQLVRTRAQYAAAGWLTLVPDVAADLKREEDRRTAYRWSTAHAEDLGALVKHMRGLARPVYLVGTSRAAISVVNAANKTKGAEAPDALVVTAGMLVHVTDEQPSAERQSGGFGRITQPTLIVYHQNDGCAYTPSASGAKAKAMLQASKKVDLKIMTGGSAGEGDPCQANSPHGFKGLDGEVVALVSDWLKALQK